MEELQKTEIEFIRTAVGFLGERTNGDACIYCGEKLNKGEYCDCPQAEKINKHFKKIGKYTENLNAYIALGVSEKELRKKVKATCLTPQLFNGMGFDDYIVECESEKNAKETVLRYFEQAIYNFLYGKNLTLLGNSGTGKTMLQTILCNSLISRWFFSCKFVNAVDLKGEITRCFNSKSNKTVDEVVNRYKTADFLFFDDIDKLTPTDFVKEFIYTLVNYRIVNELPIITSANHTLEELDSQFYNEVIVSRLINNSPVVVFNHKNRRFQA